MTTLGDCFVKAWETAKDLTHDTNEEVLICHGWVMGREGGTATPGVRHTHAWVECHRELKFPGSDTTVTVVECIDKSNGNDVSFPWQLYYRLGGIVDEHVLRYTVDEAFALMSEHMHYGPWDEDMLNGIINQTQTGE